MKNVSVQLSLSFKFRVSIHRHRVVRGLIVCVRTTLQATFIYSLRGHGLKGLGVKRIHGYYWVEILLLNYGSNPAILGKNPSD